MSGGVGPAFDLMKDRIRSTHLHDNNGQDDKHIWPILGEGGTIDWRCAMELLRSRESQYPLLLELKEVPDRKRPFDDAAEIFDRLENL
jgi:sugar phosphate isomerase/epimerase